MMILCRPPGAADPGARGPQAKPCCHTCKPLRAQCANWRDWVAIVWKTKSIQEVSEHGFLDGGNSALVIGF